MNNMTTRTFAKTNTGKLFVLEDAHAAFLSRHGAILLNSNCDVIDFFAVKDGDASKHFETNIKNLESINNAQNRLMLPNGGFLMPSIIKTIIRSKDKPSVLIIGINEKVLYGFDDNEYSDLDGLFNAITDALVAISSNKNSQVEWSAYTKIGTTQKTNSPVSAKKESETAPLAPAK